MQLGVNFSDAVVTWTLKEGVDERGEPLFFVGYKAYVDLNADMPDVITGMLTTVFGGVGAQDIQQASTEMFDWLATCESE